MTGYRLESGGLINRREPVAFVFNGRRLLGYRGDTVASAMIANGVQLVGRSFKRHRPRGIMTAGPEEPNALLGLGEGDRFEPNTRATQVQLYPGLVARSQNHWPSLNFDAMGLIDVFASMVPAGFYYKTFKWPAKTWPLYERVIRRAAGLGNPPRDPDPDDYEERYLHVDLLVIGLGAAGIAAATAATRAGLRVAAVEADAIAGGHLLGKRSIINGLPASGFAATAIARLQDAGTKVLLRTTVFGAYEQGLFGAVERLLEPGQPNPMLTPAQRLWRIRTKAAVLASGSIERPLVFPDNDRPGVMLAHAAQAYVNRFAAAPGKVAVLATNNDAAYEAMADAVDAGMAGATIIDTRKEEAIAAWALELASRRNIEVIPQACVGGVGGSHSVRNVTVSKSGKPASEVACDTLLVSGGYTPTVHLYAQARGRLSFEDKRAALLPSDPSQPFAVAGSAAGIESIGGCWEHGWRSASLVAAQMGKTPADLEQLDLERRGWGVAPEVVSIKGRASKHAFVDHQNDVTVADLKLAVQEGYESVEHLKRYTTLGMGTDQGKTSNVIGLGLLANLRGVSTADVGTTTYRPPYTPVTLSALAVGRVGKDAAVTRRTPVFKAQEAQHAVFQETGHWLRARYYPRNQESLHTATLREASAVRTAVGLYDGSSLGKVEIAGPDAVPFLEAMYAMPVAKLGVGRARYAVMLREDGFVLDDGTLWRFSANRFFATLSTARTEQVVRHLEFYRDTVLAELEVDLTDVTEQWSVMVMAGPKSEELLRSKFPEAPQLRAQGVAEWRGEGGTYRLARISYSGEKAYELYVPASIASPLWSALEATARDLGGGAYGLEALEWLRIEKGHIAVGAEINGRTLGVDLGLSRWLKATGYVGASALDKPAFRDPNRLQLVGLVSVDNAPIPEGAALVGLHSDGKDAGPLGHVTSSAFSVGRGWSIALGLLAGGHQRHGEEVIAWSPLRNRRARVRIGPPCSFDPEGTRLAK